MATRAHFTPELFEFLAKLAAHNERTWFHAHKDAYNEHVREPALAFIEDAAVKLPKISEHLRADPRPVGGSMFRIHRDVRFSKDKSPYKTHVGIHFRHAAGRDAHAPGLYLHLAPGEVFGGAGVWHPEAEALGAIRRAIAEDPGAWDEAQSGKKFQRTFRRWGEKLKRPPRGFDATHPAVEELKWKDFVFVHDFDEQQATSPGFLETYVKTMAAAAPVLAFLATALGLKF